MPEIVEFASVNVSPAPRIEERMRLPVLPEKVEFLTVRLSATEAFSQTSMPDTPNVPDEPSKVESEIVTDD